MINIKDYTENTSKFFDVNQSLEPWEIIDRLDEILLEKLKHLSNDYVIDGQIAIHKSAVIEQGVTLKGTIIVSENCFIGAHAYLRGPIFLSNAVTVGPGSEIKQAVILNQSTVAHFNFIGNTIVGENVNFEAGSICANHYNERTDKTIFVKVNNQIFRTNTIKFGALVGDNSRIGANAVLSPGTILPQNSIVNRLQLVEQVGENE